MNKTSTAPSNFVVIRIVKHLPIGLGVQDEEGQYSIIRVRELSWNLEQSVTWRKDYPIGWSGEAYALPTKEGQIKEFSLRRVQSDPWDDALQILKIGQLFDGVVTGITAYGVFIEIALGITGLLHRSRLPDWVVSGISRFSQSAKY